MAKNHYRFDLNTNTQNIIKVIGVGGGGSNAVNNMYKNGIQDVEFLVCNTDAQALKSQAVGHQLQIGIELTSGLGAGANPEIGQNAAIESKEEIKNTLIQNTKMLFITAGMGGGTGTGAAPVIAGIAKELGILTVGIVTLPFAFEGKKKLLQAQEGIQKLKENCDTVLVILNDRLREIYGNLTISNAFHKADNVLTTAAKSIAEIITVPGYVNVDFEDVKTVIKNAGAAVMGSGQASGDNRSLQAAEEAINSPLLDYQNIYGATKMLLSIASGTKTELQMDELTAITDYIQEKVGEEVEIIFGHSIEEGLEDKISVTIIATGFAKENYHANHEDYEEDTLLHTSYHTVKAQSRIITSQKPSPILQKTPIPKHPIKQKAYIPQNVYLPYKKEEFEIPTVIRKSIAMKPIEKISPNFQWYDVYSNKKIQYKS